MPEGLEAIRKHRTELEEVAGSDLRVSYIAQALLDAADEADAGERA